MKEFCCINLKNLEFINPWTRISIKINVCPFCGKVLNIKRLNKVRKEVGLPEWEEAK